MNEQNAEYVVVAEHEEEHWRRELRYYTDGTWQAVAMRRQVGGGWYVRDAISVPQQIDGFGAQP